jgi:hypothetical protein
LGILNGSKIPFFLINPFFCHFQSRKISITFVENDSHMKHLFLIFAFLFPTLINAQQGWTKVVGTTQADAAADVQIAPDSGFWLSSENSPGFQYEATIYRFDANGNEQWRTGVPYYIDSYVALPKIVAQQNENIWISAGNTKVKYDPNGMYLQTTQPNGICSLGLIIDKNGHDLWDFGGLGYRLGLNKIDTAGNISAYYNCLCGFGTATYDRGGAAYSAQSLTDGSLLIGGFNMNGGINSQGQVLWARKAALVIKLNAQAQEVWKKVYEENFEVKSLASQAGTAATYALFSAVVALPTVPISHLVLLNQAGTKIWDKPMVGIFPKKLITAPDGGVFVFGEKNSGSPVQILLQKYNATGDLEWEKNYVRPENLAFGSASLFPDGSFIIAASQLGVPEPQVVLFKTDSLGNQAIASLGVTLVNDAPCTEARGKLSPNITGNAIGNLHYQWNTGDTTEVLEYFKAGNYSVTVTDNDGAAAADTFAVKDLFKAIPVFEKLIEGNNYNRIENVVQTSDGGFAFIGINSLIAANDFNVILVKMSQSGAVQWKKTYGGSGSDFGYSLQQMPDNGFVLIGTTNSTNGDVSNNVSANYERNFWIIRTDSIGTILWEKTRGGSGEELNPSVLRFPDNELVFGGTTSSEDGQAGQGFGENDILIWKTDEDGIFKWQKRLGGNEGEYLFKLLNASDTEFYAVLTSSFAAPVTPVFYEQNIWVYRISKVDGTVLWTKKIGGSRSERIDFAKVLPDNRLAIGFYTFSQDFPGLNTQGQEAAAILFLLPEGVVDTVINFDIKSKEQLVDLTQNGPDSWILAIDEHISGAKVDYWLVETDTDFKEKKRAHAPIKTGYDLNPTRIFKTNADKIWLFTSIPEVGTFSKNDYFIQQYAGIFDNADFLKEDTLVCQNSTTSITPIAGSLQNFQNPTWDDNSTNLLRNVHLGTNDSLFYLKATTPDGCEAADYITVKTDKLDFETKILLDAKCSANNGWAEITIKNPIGLPNILWADGNTQWSRGDLSEGNYSFVVSDSICQKSGSLTIKVDTSGAPRPNAGWQVLSYQNTTNFSLDYYTFKVLPDGGYIVSSISVLNGIPYIIRANIAGTILWQTSETVTGRYTQTEMYDNGNLLLVSVPNNIQGIRLYKFGINGQLLTQKSITDVYTSENHKTIAAANGGAYILSLSYSNGSYDIEVRKLDASLSTVWTKSFGGSSSEAAYDLLELPNGNLVVLAATNSTDGLPMMTNDMRDIWVFSLDPQGNVLWSKTFGGNMPENPHSLHKSGDGFIVAGASASVDGDLANTANAGFWREWVFKIDEIGNLLWSNIKPTVWAYTVNEFPNIILSVDKSNQNGVVVVGIETRAFDGNGDLSWTLPQRKKMYYDGNISWFYPEYYAHTTYLTQDPWHIYYQAINMKRLTLPLMPPVFSLGADTSLCHGNSITIGHNAPDGYFYRWSNNFGLGAKLNTVNYPTNYSLTISSATGCTATDTIIVYDDTFSILGGGVDTVLHNINLILSDTYAPFTYKWSNGDSTPSLLNVAPGHYFVTVTDKNGCTDVASFLVQYTVNTAENTVKTNLKAYPNPSSDVLWVEINVPKLPEKFIAKNALGQIFDMPLVSKSIEQNKGIFQFNLSEWPSGLYWILADDAMIKVLKHNYH